MKGFGRRKKERDMMIKNLACSIILYENVVTTKAKGKEVRKFLDKLISKAKRQRRRDYVVAVRTLVRELPDKKAAMKAFDILLDAFGDRTGGYVSILPYYSRKSDNAPRVKLILNY